MEAYPEMLSAINRYCFIAMISMPDDVFNIIVQAIVWAFKHSMRNVAEIGMEILRELLVKVAESENQASAQAFYQKYFMQILEHVLSVVTDHNQVPFIGLTNLSEAVCLLFQAAESTIQVPLNAANPAQANMEFVYEAITTLFSSHFKNLNEAQIRVTIKGFFSYNRILSKMREHIRDFLVQIKEEAGENYEDLFLEDKEAETRRIQAEKLAIPGVQNPNDVEDEDMV